MKHVQAELPDPVYEELAALARREGHPIKAMAREAIEAYLRRATDPAEDPLHDLVGAGTLPEGAWSERDDWRTARGERPA